jgi:YidC/Oxa1 family membrane protein insertase
MNFDRNTVIGWVLIAAVFIGFMVYNSKNAQQQAAQMRMEQIQDSIAQHKSDSIREVTARQEAAKIKAQQTDSTNVFFAARQGKGGKTTLKNELLKLDISNQGAQVVRAELLDQTYRNQQGGNVVLFDEGDSKLQLAFEGKDQNILSDEFFFTPSAATDSSVVMTLPLGQGQISVTYTLKAGSYLLDMEVKAEGLQGFFPVKTQAIDVSWTERMRQQEKGFSFENSHSSIVYRTTDDDTETLSSTGGDKDKSDDDIEGRVRWTAFKTQFFSQILIAHEGMDVQRLKQEQVDEANEGEGYLKTYEAYMSVPFDPTGGKATEFTFYIGPNKFSTLKNNEVMIDQESHLDLQSIVYLGWPIVRLINRFVFLYLFDFMTGWGLNMGIVLLIITIIVKLAVFPLMKKSYLSSANMRVLRPKVDEINAKYPNPQDAMKKQQETMQLYAQYGVSPMGGCLPMVIQFPIWIALFNFIPNAIELRGQSFLWADDLSTYDDVINWGFHIWGIGDHLSLFCVLWCLSTVATTWISMRQQSYSMSPEQEQSMKMMRWMSYLMPVIFFFSFNSYSSGLNYYYFVSGLTTILLMWFLRKTTDDAKLLAKLEARFKERKSNPRKASSMMERMQRMAEQQQEILRQQQEAQKKK